MTLPARGCSLLRVPSVTADRIWSCEMLWRWPPGPRQCLFTYNFLDSQEYSITKLTLLRNNLSNPIQCKFILPFWSHGNMTTDKRSNNVVLIFPVLSIKYFSLRWCRAGCGLLMVEHFYLKVLSLKSFHQHTFQPFLTLSFSFPELHKIVRTVTNISFWIENLRKSRSMSTISLGQQIELGKVARCVTCKQKYETWAWNSSDIIIIYYHYQCLRSHIIKNHQMNAPRCLIIKCMFHSNKVDISWDKDKVGNIYYLCKYLHSTFMLAF